MSRMNEIMEQAREASWSKHGKRIAFYLPGMFSCNGTSGKYPALSITGSACTLQCEHCRAKILSLMIHVTEPSLLVEKCVQLEKNGNLGVLISGGCDKEGRLPWEKFIPALSEIKMRTGLKVSVHSGFVDEATALRLKDAGVDQVLIDIIGDDETYRRIYHLESGSARLMASLQALDRAGLPMAPHIVCGIFGGKIRAEMEAIDIISKFHPDLLIIVSLMRVPGTPFWGVDPPSGEAVAGLIARARIKMPETQISLGCARQRGDDAVEVLAIDAGVNRLALPSEASVNRARYYGLEVEYRNTCCSVNRCIPESDWRVC